MSVGKPIGISIALEKGTGMGQCAELRKLHDCELPNSVFAGVEDLL